MNQLLESIAVRMLNALARKPLVRVPDGMLLGTSVDVSGQTRPIVWPDTRLAEHMFIAGRSGSGKTHLQLTIALAMMRAGYGIFAVDVHGDMARDLLGLASTCPNVADRLVVVDPTDRDWSPGLNPLELTTADPGELFRRTSELARVLRLRWGMETLGVRTEEVLRNALHVAASQGLTLVDVPLLLSSAMARERLVRRITNAEVRSFWVDRFGHLSESMQRTYTEPVLNKLTDDVLPENDGSQN